MPWTKAKIVSIVGTPHFLIKLVVALVLPVFASGGAAPPDKPSKIHLVSKILGKDFLSETI